MKFKSTSNEEASLSFNDLENTQNTSGETATSSAKDAGTDKLSITSKTGTTKSSSTSSEEGDESNNSNSESQDKMEMEMVTFWNMKMPTMMKMTMKMRIIYLSSHNHQKTM